MNAILQSIGQDTDSVKILAEGWARADAIYQTYFLNNAYGSPELQAEIMSTGDTSAYQESIRRGAGILANIMDQAITGNKALASDEKAQDELLKDLLDIGASIPVPGLGKALEAGNIVDWLYSQGKGEAIEHAKERIAENTTQGDYEALVSLNDATVASAVDAHIQILYDQGCWSDETLAAQAMLSGIPREPPPQAAFLPDEDGNRTNQFNLGSEEYQYWRDHQSNVKTIIETPIGNAYGLMI